jgi:hypothetical protein
VQHHAADQLHVEMAHVEDAAAGLANHGERTQPFLNALPELVRLGAQLRVSELLHLWFEGIDGPDPGHHALDHPLVLGPKDLANQCVDQTVKSFRGRELPKGISI